MRRAIDVTSRSVSCVCLGTTLLFAMGCSDDTPTTPKFRVQGAVLPGGDPSASGIVALLFPAGMNAQFLQARITLPGPPSSSNVWPFEQFQRLVYQAQQLEPISAVVTNNL